MQQWSKSSWQIDAYGASQAKLLISLLEAESLLRRIRGCRLMARADVPAESAMLLKQVEDLGLVSRRNASALVLQEQRLQKLLHRLMRYVPGELQLECQQRFSWVVFKFCVAEMALVDGGNENANANRSEVKERHGLDLEPNHFAR